jgi:nickel/cobalt transporter (NicO) family protein
VTLPWRVAVVATSVAAIVLVSAAIATAHPLGNFTINTSASLTIRTEEILVDYIVDMAEIPAFRESRAMDADGDGLEEVEIAAYAEDACAGYEDRIDLRVNERIVELAQRQQPDLTFPPGTGGLTTLRLECHLAGSLVEAPIPGDRPTGIRYSDLNHDEAIGWREVVAIGDGVSISDADVPTRSTTDALRSYPNDALPLDVRTASLLVIAGGPEADSRAVPAAATSSAASGGVLASLMGRTDVTPGLVALMVLVAMIVGAVHALGPGHGKTIIGAYLVGAEGSIRQAVSVGLAVSLMHTVSVLALGVIVLAAERAIAPERIYPWLGIVAGTIAVSLGVTLLVGRLRQMASRDVDGRMRREAASQVHALGHGHSHGHGHEHEHEHVGAISRRGLTALAVSGGALPSPTALIVLLGAISVGRAALGLTLIASFSLGLAAALIGVGVLALRTRDVASRRVSTRVMRFVPPASAGLIIAMGLFLAVRGLTQLY